MTSSNSSCSGKNNSKSKTCPISISLQAQLDREAKGPKRINSAMVRACFEPKPYKKPADVPASSTSVPSKAGVPASSTSVPSKGERGTDDADDVDDTGDVDNVDDAVDDSDEASIRTLLANIFGNGIHSQLLHPRHEIRNAFDTYTNEDIGYVAIALSRKSNQEKDETQGNSMERQLELARQNGVKGLRVPVMSAEGRRSDVQFARNKIMKTKSDDVIGLCFLHNDEEQSYAEFNDDRCRPSWVGINSIIEQQVGDVLNTCIIFQAPRNCNAWITKG